MRFWEDYVICMVSETRWNLLNATFMLAPKTIPKPWALKAGQALEFWDSIVLHAATTTELAWQAPALFTEETSFKKSCVCGFFFFF